MSPQVRERELRSWKLIADFKERLASACSEAPIGKSWSDPKRQLQAADYLSLFLFGLFNPVVETMRGLCAASQLPRVQEEVCGRRVSLGSFSEAQHLLDPGLLEKVLKQLTEEVDASRSPNQLSWLIQDSTLWYVLPRMQWALWRHQKVTQRAVRLHVSLQIDSGLPANVTVSNGVECERRAWKRKWRPGDAYVGDAYFGQDYRCLDELSEMGSRYVVRLREDAYIDSQQELPLSVEDQQARVIGDEWVRLGHPSRYTSGRLRLVRVQTPKEILLLATNLPPELMSAGLVAELYRKRWQVELFFRWLKCILGCRHWLAESEEGVALQVYLALIAAALLQLYTGQRPNRRMLEMVTFYLLGVATIDDLEATLKKQLRLAKKS